MPTTSTVPKFGLFRIGFETVRRSPSGSESLASTLIVSGVRLSVVSAGSSTASGVSFTSVTVTPKMPVDAARPSGSVAVTSTS